MESLEESLAAIQNKLTLSQNGKIKASEVHRGVILYRNPHRTIIEDFTIDLIFQPPAEEIPPPNTATSNKGKKPA
jgi:hypothetical protein